MSTPHNEANLGDIAKTVIMPGDPLRAKYIAENFLDNYKLVNYVWLLEWGCQVWEYIHMNYINTMELKIL